MALALRDMLGEMIVTGVFQDAPGSDPLMDWLEGLPGEKVLAILEESLQAAAPVYCEAFPELSWILPVAAAFRDLTVPQIKDLLDRAELNAPLGTYCVPKENALRGLRSALGAALRIRTTGRRYGGCAGNAVLTLASNAWLSKYWDKLFVGDEPREGVSLQDCVPSPPDGARPLTVGQILEPYTRPVLAPILRRLEEDRV